METDEEMLKFNGTNETKRGIDFPNGTQSKTASSIYGETIEMATLRPYIEILDKPKQEKDPITKSKTKVDV